nr:hypothetical protein [Tanacetum cinerariifolium]
SGPTWLFDIDSLIKTMNYQPVTAGNQSNPSAGFQDTFDAEKAGEESDQQYVIFLVWSPGSTNPQNTDGDAAFDGKEPSLMQRSTNTFSVDGPSNAAASPTHKKSSFIDDSKLLDDPDMPELEDITYSNDEDDVSAEADFNNFEASITITTQTRSMTIVAKDQGGISQMFIDDFHTWFEDPDHPNKVYKVVKALYGLHQAPRACKAKEGWDIYPPDKYVAETLRKFGLTEEKSASTPIDTEKPLLKDLDGENVDVHTYRHMLLLLVHKLLFFSLTNWCCLLSAVRSSKLARMGYEKPSTKLTFYKAFFSSQWKFLIYIILQYMSAKRTSWNEFNSSIASAIICLSLGRKFNFSKYIFDSLVAEEGDAEVHGEEVNDGDTAEGDVTAAHGEVPTADEEPSIPSPKPPTPSPQPSHDIPSTSQVERRNKVKVLKLRRLQKVGTSHRVETSDETVMDDVSNQGRMIAEMDQDADVVLEDDKEYFLYTLERWSSIFYDISDKGFLVRVDQEIIVKRVPTSSHRVLLMQSRAIISLMSKEVHKKTGALILINLRGCLFGRELKSFIYKLASV